MCLVLKWPETGGETWKEKREPEIIKELENLTHQIKLIANLKLMIILLVDNVSSMSLYLCFILNTYNNNSCINNNNNINY